MFRHIPPGLRTGAAVLALAFGLGACGGGGGGGGAGGAASTPAPAAPPVAMTPVQPAAPGAVPSAGLSVVAGEPGGPGNLDGVDGRLAGPVAIALGPDGMLYITDSLDGRDRTGPDQVSRLRTADLGTGALTTVDADPMTKPVMAMAFDLSGNLYEATETAIYRTAPGGRRTLFAGSATESAVRDGQGTDARFKVIYDIAVDAGGRLLVADGNQLRTVTPDGAVALLAGSPMPEPYTGRMNDGTGTEVRFALLSGIAVDPLGNITVMDGASLRRVTAGGTVTTRSLFTAGPGGNTPVTTFQGNRIAADAAGNVYVAEYSGGCHIRKVAPDGEVKVLDTGSGYCVYAPLPSGVYIPSSNVVIDRAGNLYVGDVDGRTIRRVTAAGAVDTVAGRAPQAGNVDGKGGAARFALSPPLPMAGLSDVPPYYELVADTAGNVYVGEGDRVRQVAADGAVTTRARPAGAAQGALLSASGLAWGGGEVVVENSTIGRVGADGAVKVIAGQVGARGANDGAGTQASFNLTHEPVVDGLGNIYVIDFAMDGSGRLLERKISPDGTVTTLPAPRFLHQVWYADRDGNVWDMLAGGTLTRIDPDGKRTVVREGNGEGAGPQPVAITRDAAGNTFVGMREYNGWYAVHRIAPSGEDTIIAGTKDALGVRPGKPGSLGRIDGLAAGPDGTVYVLSENAVLRILP